MAKMKGRTIVALVAAAIALLLIQLWVWLSRVDL
jgi:hypothetical protein